VKRPPLLVRTQSIAATKDAACAMTTMWLDLAPSSLADEHCIASESGTGPLQEGAAKLERYRAEGKASEAAVLGPKGGGESHMTAQTQTQACFSTRRRT
jgi:hypothetical protein